MSKYTNYYDSVIRENERVWWHQKREQEHWERVRNALVMTHICSTRDRQILELDSMTSRKEYKIEFLKTSRRGDLEPWIKVLREAQRRNLQIRIYRQNGKMVWARLDCVAVYEMVVTYKQKCGKDKQKIIPTDSITKLNEDIRQRIQEHSRDSQSNTGTQSSCTSMMEDSISSLPAESVTSRKSTLQRLIQCFSV